MVLLAMYMMVGFRRYGVGSAGESAAPAPADLTRDVTEALEIDSAERTPAPDEEEGKSPK